MILLSKGEEKEYKEFLEAHDRCNFQQALEWGNVKTSWKNEVVLAKGEAGNIIGAISVLIRKIPIFGNFMYVSRGPICDIHDEKVLKELSDGLKELAKQYKAFTLRMEPDIKSSDEEFKNIIKELGFKINDKGKNFSDGIQPRYVFRLDLKGKTEDQIFAEFHQKTRYNVRLATKKGVEIREGTKEDLKDFHKIMVVTGKRDNFMIRPLSYFEQMYDCLAPKHLKVMMAYYNGQPISGIIDIIYGNKIWYLYGASSNDHRNLMPNYLLQWEMIKYAIEHGKDMYDFRGVTGIVDEKDPHYGLYRFKKGFNAEFTEFVGEVYINLKPVRYRLYKMSERIYKNLAEIKTKTKNLNLIIRKTVDFNKAERKIN